MVLTWDSQCTQNFPASRFSLYVTFKSGIDAACKSYSLEGRHFVNAASTLLGERSITGQTKSDPCTTEILSSKKSNISNFIWLCTLPAHKTQHNSVNWAFSKLNWFFLCTTQPAVRSLGLDRPQEGHIMRHRLEEGAWPPAPSWSSCLAGEELREVLEPTGFRAVARSWCVRARGM